MAKIDDLEHRVSVAFKDRAKSFWRTSLFVKIAMVTVATSVLALAQYMEIPKDTSLTGWQSIKIAAALIAGVGGVFVIFTEKDSSVELSLAQDAIEEAKIFSESPLRL